MLNKDHRYLKLVKYKNIENWSVSHILGMNMGFNKKYPLIPIGHIIEKSINSINIEDHVTYKQITLKINGGGTILRDVKLGKLIGTKKQFVVSAGQFIMSKIDARNGAFGVIGTDLDGAVVTADFPVFNVIKERVTPEYLTLVSSTAQFVRFAQTCSRGTTNRQRIDVNLFLSQKIPLPSLSEQQALIKSYNNKIQQAETLEKQAAEIEQNIEDYLLTELGIKQNINTANHKDEIKKEYKYLKFIKFKDSERWDVSYYSQRKRIEGKYNTVFMNKCIENFMQDEKGRSLRIETSKLPEKDFQYIGMESVEKGTGLLVENKKVKGKEIKSQTVRVPYHYFLYGKLRPYLNKYWFNENHNDNIVCSSEFFVFSIKHDINDYYFKYYLSSAAVQQQISNAFQGARMPRINERTFNTIQVLLPPISIQNAIVEHINKQKSQIKERKQLAETLRTEALEEFEKEVFE